MSAVVVVFGLLISSPCSFPSLSSRLLWGICALVTTVIPITVILFIKIDKVDWYFYWLSIFLLIVFCLSYVAARISLFQFVLAFVSLKNMSPEALVTVKWSLFIPHV